MLDCFPCRVANMGIRFQALGDLYQRYRQIFSLAWQHRAEMEPPARLQHELEFLPATLSLQETPVHPAPRVTMWLIVIFSLLALIWSILGHVDVVATATGKVVPNSRSKLIQPLEAASVQAIHVNDGQSVQFGELLIELDSTTSEADIERLRHEHLSAYLEMIRFQALLEAQESGAQPQVDELSVVIDEERLRDELEWVSGLFHSYEARIDQLDAIIGRREAELRATRALLVKLQSILPITRQRESDYHELLGKNHVSRHQYLELKSSLIEQENDIVSQNERLHEIEALMLEAEQEKNRFIKDSRRDWLDKFNDAKRRSLSLSQELIKSENRNKYMSLTSPVDGFVQQLSVHTVGGVVTPAETLMVIVPKDSDVEIEALLPNKDIGFVHPGQEVEVKFETFSFTRYGTIRGKIFSVSSDAIQDEKLGLVFSVRIKLEKDNIVVNGTPVRLSPGMASTVEIKTDRRRLIDYFLSPLKRYADESLRER